MSMSVITNGCPEELPLDYGKTFDGFEDSEESFCDNRDCGLLSREEAYQLLDDVVNVVAETRVKLVEARCQLSIHLDESSGNGDLLRADIFDLSPGMYEEYPVYRQFVRDRKGCVDPFASAAYCGLLWMVSRGIPDQGPECGAALWLEIDPDHRDLRLDYDCGDYEERRKYFGDTDKDSVLWSDVGRLVDDMVEDIQYNQADLAKTRLEISEYLEDRAESWLRRHLTDDFPNLSENSAAYRDYVSTWCRGTDPFESDAWKYRLGVVSQGGRDPGPEPILAE